MTCALCRRLMGAALVALLSACAALPAPGDAPPSAAYTGTSTKLAQLVRRNAELQETAKRSGFRLLPDAAYSLDARIALARNAEESLDIQYYFLNNDEVGLRLLRELRDASARGVRVRLLIDDLYAGDEDQLFLALSRYPGIEVRMFNPLPARGGAALPRIVRSLHEFSRINHRMHNKMFIADNSLSVSGGRNIAAEYFMRSASANFIDIDVLSAGAVVRQQSIAFDTYWNSDYVRPIANIVSSSDNAAAAQRRFDELSVEATPLPELPGADGLGRNAISGQLDRNVLPLTWAGAQVFVDDPSKIARTTFESRFAGSVTERTLAIIRAAKSKVVIASPYFIPGEIGMDIIRNASARGVTTVLVTNSLGATDEPLVYAGYARYRAEMLKLGVVIYEIGPSLTRRSSGFGDFGQSTGRLHAKLAVIDGRSLFIGSMNLDGRSASLNTETGLLIESTDLVEDFERLVQADRFASSYRLRLTDSGEVQWVEQTADGSVQVHGAEPDASWLIKIKNLLVSPFVREELL